VRDRPNPIPAADITIGVAVAEFNQAITDRLLGGCQKVLDEAGVAVQTLKVPGAWELPVAALALARAGCQGVVAIGAVIKGETDHYEVIVRESAAGLTRVSLDTGIPVTNAVLTVHDYQQALDRSEPGAGNKGAEAARAAVELTRRIQALVPETRAHPIQ
jgi:6,7-dimethyl-8-ribityllumazine synthase